jgi:hypothetical protein
VSLARLNHTSKMQNTSHAVMAQRTEPPDSLDDFPTPPWATGALFEHVIGGDMQHRNCLEPACGAGHMSKVLMEYFGEVKSRDISDYGYGAVEDYLHGDISERYDWIITNPPFKLGERFILRALGMAREGAAFLVRTTFIESVGRYNRLFSSTPPTIFAQFVERVPMVKGRLDQSASTATGYCWLVWRKGQEGQPRLVWIPPCRRGLERANDYGSAQLRLV